MENLDQMENDYSNRSELRIVVQAKPSHSWKPIAMSITLCVFLILVIFSGKPAEATIRNLSVIVKENTYDTMTVGAYYYPWYGKKFHSEGGYLRQNLSQGPMLGEYDDTRPDVVQQHLKWSQYAHIGLWLTSWWGPNRLEDDTTKNVILKVIEGTSHKIALLYETLGRLKDDNGTQSTHRITDDISYMADTYFEHPNYFRINSRPVLVLYVTRTLDDQPGLLEETLLLARTAAAKKGYNIYLIGDQAFGNPPVMDGTLTPEAKAFDYLDAVTNYDVYGSMGRDYADQTDVDNFYDKQKIWRELSKKENCAFIPSVTPGYNDLGVRMEANHTPLSRKLSPTSPEGSLFEASLKRAIRQVDPTVGNLLFVNSFNEWHEDTQIEPCVGTTTDEPYDLTRGLEYEGYGLLYLNILKKMTPQAVIPPNSQDSKASKGSDKRPPEHTITELPNTDSKRKQRGRKYHNVFSDDEEDED